MNILIMSAVLIWTLTTAAMTAAAEVTRQLEQGNSAIEVSSSIEAQETPTVRVVRRYEIGMERGVNVKRLHDFTQELSLSVRTHPDYISQKRLTEIIEKLDLSERLGIPIANIAMYAPKDLILAYEGGRVEILSDSLDAEGRTVVRASFRNENGNFIAPVPGMIRGLNWDGKPVCFDVKTVEEHPKPSFFTLLVDRSGSMSSVMPQVRSAASAFLNQLPNNAQCRVISFNSSSTAHHPGEFANCQSLSLTGIDAGGGTNLYAPLGDEFSLYNNPRFADSQRAVFVITDGQISSDPQAKESLVNLKGKTLNFVYFLGNHVEQHLEGLADNFLQDAGNLNFNLNQYFDVMGNMISMQRMLTQVPCT